MITIGFASMSVNKQCDQTNFANCKLRT
jgi:hypothetical protein